MLLIIRLRNLPHHIAPFIRSRNSVTACLALDGKLSQPLCDYGPPSLSLSFHPLSRPMFSLPLEQ